MTLPGAVAEALEEDGVLPGHLLNVCDLSAALTVA